jgi:hypothetical protein
VKPPPTYSPDKANPDWLLVGDLPHRLPDRGPRYAETPADPSAPDAPWIAEPLNTITAALFIVIVAYWLIRLRGRYSHFPFVVSCLPILLVGGIGGTLYHAFRTRQVYFFLDVIPISLLGLAGALFLTFRLGRWHGWVKVGTYAIGAIVAYVGLNGILFRQVEFSNPNMRVNLSYASLALVVTIPLLGVLLATRFRQWQDVAAGLAAFGIAFFCRLLDNTATAPPPYGSHFLWHIFGALCTHFLIRYFAFVESAPVPGKPPEPPLGSPL